MTISLTYFSATGFIAGSLALSGSVRSFWCFACFCNRSFCSLGFSCCFCFCSGGSFFSSLGIGSCLQLGSFCGCSLGLDGLCLGSILLLDSLHTFRTLGVQLDQTRDAVGQTCTMALPVADASFIKTKTFLSALSQRVIKTDALNEAAIAAIPRANRMITIYLFS